MTDRPLFERIRVNLLKIAQRLRCLLTVQHLDIADDGSVCLRDHFLVFLLDRSYDLLPLYLSQALRAGH